MSTPQILAIIFATIAQFIVGAIWYTPLFGKLWGKIHGFEKLDKKTQEKMIAEMGPIFGVQLIITIVTAVVLTTFKIMLSSYSLYQLTFLIWLGFVVPAQISGILFGGTESKWILTKSLVMAGGSLIALLTGSIVVNLILK